MWEIECSFLYGGMVNYLVYEIFRYTRMNMTNVLYLFFDCALNNRVRYFKKPMKFFRKVFRAV